MSQLLDSHQTLSIKYKIIVIHENKL